MWKYAVPATLGLLSLVGGTAQHRPAIVVDHTSLPLFEQIPEAYIRAAENLRMMFVNRSVGQNINEGLSCLNEATDEVARTSCKRFNHVVPEFSSPRPEVTWSRSGGYSRENWDYYAWPVGPTSTDAGSLPCGGMATGSWPEKLECFVKFVDAHADRYDVFSYQFSYLEVDGSNDILSPTNGYFTDQPNRYDITDIGALERRHRDKVFVLHTTSLARSIGTQAATDFNNQIRAYVQANDRALLDVADIESHDPWGRPCFDNRDGKPYSVGNVSENYPDDLIAMPALCQHYTREANGGHLGNPDVGKIRLARAYWILMARLAGWNPETP